MVWGGVCNISETLAEDSAAAASWLVLKYAKENFDSWSGDGGDGAVVWGGVGAALLVQSTEWGCQGGAAARGNILDQLLILLAYSATTSQIIIAREILWRHFMSKYVAVFLSWRHSVQTYS